VYAAVVTLGLPVVPALWQAATNAACLAWAAAICVAEWVAMVDMDASSAAAPREAMVVAVTLSVEIRGH